jgi:hypothetical protein
MNQSPIVERAVMPAMSEVLPTYVRRAMTGDVASWQLAPRWGLKRRQEDSLGLLIVDLGGERGL